MTQDMNAFTALYKAVCEDKATRQALMNTPQEVLSKHGLSLPSNIEFKSVDDCMHAPNCIHITVEDAGSLCVRADNASEC
ncbi:MAG: hypothetical protein P8J45_08915 [Phycisphaerales bacterium]|nr:hypothetical protein [Phycisphaerales bacterium]